MKILAIDPGTTESAIVCWDAEGGRIEWSDKVTNEAAIVLVTNHCGKPLFVEQIASYGMAVGRDVFTTCWWSGRFFQAHGNATMIERRLVKLHHCGSAKAKDGNIRQALIDRFGGKGTKAAPGPFYGVSADVWQAVALAVYAADQMKSQTV